MIFKTILAFSLISKKTNWEPSTWRSKIAFQQPLYENITEVKFIQEELKRNSPLVFAGECRELKKKLAMASVGKGFVLMGGECAESISSLDVNKLRDTFCVLLQMALVLSYGSSVPIIKLYRGAGQYAKPRSSEYEDINGVKLPSYRGDIINSIEFTEEGRKHKPQNMINAYNHATQILNILRAFSFGGYADISRLNNWNLDFVARSSQGNKYKALARKVSKAVKFVESLGVKVDSPQFKQTDIYTAHECLLLPYEEALTRKDSVTGNWYGCSGGLLWVGERTRQLDGAHIEYIRGIENPVGIKVSHTCKPEDLISLLDTVNPDNEPGKVVVITRMGSFLKKCLPPLVKAVKEKGKIVVWCCDPVHGNTVTTSLGIKTRSFDAIKKEINDFFSVHHRLGTYPGGIHLEMTGEDVTECVGGMQNITIADLNKKYLTNCDPRLNGVQSLELAFLVAGKMKNFP